MKQIENRMVNISAKASVFYGLHLKKEALEKIENLNGKYDNRIKYLQSSFFETNKNVINEKKENNELLQEGYYEETQLHLLNELNNISNSIENHIVTQSDVLLSSKNSNFLATTIDFNSNKSKILICSTVFLIIRIHNINEINPEYLKYILNTQKYQQQLKSEASGIGNQQVLTKQIVKSLQLPLPSIDVQEKIIDVLKGREMSKELTMSIENLIDAKIESQLFQII